MTDAGVIDADNLMLVEEFPDEPAARLAVLPARSNRTPIEAGFILTWREQPVTGRSYRRTGMVLALGPRACSVWVQPDDPRPGEGSHVLVLGVTEKDCRRASRSLRDPRDYLSTAEWQRPRLLPRAFVRVDRVDDGGRGYVTRALHADRDCPAPGSPFGPVTRGRARRVQTCYVFRGYLHPCSIRPVDPDRRKLLNSFVRVCGTCLRDGRP